MKGAVKKKISPRTGHPDREGVVAASPLLRWDFGRGPSAWLIRTLDPKPFRTHRRRVIKFIVLPANLSKRLCLSCDVEPVYFQYDRA